MSDPLDLRLEAPETSLSELSFVETSSAALTQWTTGLPLANIAETAAQLQIATAELALLKAGAQDKYDYLEAVRPLLHYICARLDRSLFSAAKSAQESQAQRLLLNLCTGYKSVVLDSFATRQNNKELLQSALHRLISDLSRILLRSLQLYVTPPDNFWWELNELYRLADVLELTDFRLADDENHSDTPISIEATYLRALLLASSKPNQLHHGQLSSVFNALERWTAPVGLERDSVDALLTIDLMANAGPQYAKLARDQLEPRGLHTEVLAYEIEAYLNDVDSRFIIPKALDRGLLRHLVEAWSVMQTRTFGRFASNVAVRVAVGLRATHYFLSGGGLFTDQLTNTDELLRREVNPFLDVDYEPSQGEEADVWSQAHDLKVRIPQNPNIQTPETILIQKPAAEPRLRAFVHYETVAIDTSPGGYRMTWIDAVPSNATVGELVALREEQASRWCVAVIRWIRQEGEAISMGVELLSPRAIPVALRAIRKKGGPPDYARGLLLPQIEALNQTATIITPVLPFVGKQKIQIQRQGIHTTGQLLKSQLKTESFNQFTYRMLDGYLENARSDSNIDNLTAMTKEDTSQGP